VRLSWTIANATGVEISIDSPDGVYEAIAGSSGYADVPFSCTEDHHVYYLATTGGSGPSAEVHKTVTRTT
jgi:hypothetical protein